MTVRIRLFAILRERAGRDQVEVELPEPATVADALHALAQLPGLGALAQGGARMAVNREYATEETVLDAEDELALIPPVSGGAAITQLEHVSDRVRVAIGSAPLDIAALGAFVSSSAAGAVVIFQGMPRDIPVLDYEAYGDMALERMALILTEVVGRAGLTAAAAEHRVGPVPELVASVAVAVSAPHREAAFSGAREMLDRIKAEVPIWKVEVDGSGARHRPDGVLPR